MKARKEILDFMQGIKENELTQIVITDESDKEILVEKKEGKFLLNIDEVTYSNISTNTVRLLLAYDILKNNPSRAKDDVLFKLITDIVVSSLKLVVKSTTSK